MFPLDPRLVMIVTAAPWRPDRERRRRVHSAAAYDLAAATLPPRRTTGAWRLMLTAVLARRLAAW
jgi:hypothetical protein